MVSSTFYDLKQVRRDLASFLGDELGYQALLSELPSFPVNPDLDTIENCSRRVRDDADVLVLVVGGRYGSIDDRTAKSVTNIEYLTARSKGIPVYVFVESRILTILPIWKKNPDANYADEVDTVELFRFVDTIRDAHKTWVFPFEVAQDIVKVLRAQLAHLFLSGLRLNRHLHGDGLPHYLEHAGPETLRIALEKPRAWEYRLFFQSWLDEVGVCAWQLRDHRAKVAIGVSENVSPESASEWLLTRSHELQGLVTALNHLLNVETAAAFGEPGQPGDPDHIMWITSKIGEILRLVLEWSQRVRRARVHQPFERAALEMAGFVNSVVEQVTAFPSDNLDKLDQALQIANPENPQALAFTLTIQLSNFEPFVEALQEAQRFFEE